MEFPFGDHVSGSDVHADAARDHLGRGNLAAAQVEAALAQAQAQHRIADAIEKLAAYVGALPG
ncbi:hypothetical protein [Amycolatopsis sp. NPDC054798]